MQRNAEHCKVMQSNATQALCVKHCVLHPLRGSAFCVCPFCSMASSMPCDAFPASKLRRLRATATKQRLHAASENQEGIRTIQSQLAVLTSTVDGLCYYVSSCLLDAGIKAAGSFDWTTPEPAPAMFAQNVFDLPHAEHSEQPAGQTNSCVKSCNSENKSCNANVREGG